MTRRDDARLTLVSNNPNPALTLRLAPPLRVVSDRERIEHAATERDDEFEKYKAELTRGGGLVSRRFEWCKNWRDILEEWDDIMWVLPPSEEERKERERENWSRLAATGTMLAEEDRCFKTDPAYRAWIMEKARRGAEELADSTKRNG